MLPDPHHDPSRARLEVCVDQVQTALDSSGLADRIEFCGRLDLDGVTPKWEELQRLQANCDLPIHVMIRPARGGCFVCNPEELDQMEGEIERARELGVQGLVFGALDESGELDEPALRRLCSRAQDLPVTFHRAFDLIANKPRALECLIEFGVARVLTTGGPPRAWEGRECLRQLVEQAAGRIIVMPGGGVRQDHVKELLSVTGAVEVHSSKALRL